MGIAGYKNSGKTTLVVELIREFRLRGLRVATIKHAHHEFDIDHEGKDSYQHRAAGAVEVIIASARRWAHIAELDNANDEPPLAALLARLGDVDLVLIEGYKHGDHPKLELRRADQDQRPLFGAEANVVGIVADGPQPKVGCPVVSRQDIPAIAEFILLHAGSIRQEPV
jgi:molybdopterin-guanine dinucleotide biosynthesis protein B